MGNKSARKKEDLIPEVVSPESNFEDSDYLEFDHKFLNQIARGEVEKLNFDYRDRNTKPPNDFSSLHNIEEKIGAEGLKVLHFLEPIARSPRILVDPSYEVFV
jgi:hypothetical protein